MLFVVSSVILAIIALGWKYRRNAGRHIPLMMLAFAMDIALLLYIELTRHAIQTVESGLQAPQSKELLFFHVIVSLITVVLYIAQIGSGILLARKANAAYRNFHKVSAMAFITCRLANYATSFFVGQN